LWSLRHTLRNDLPRCPLLPQRFSYGFAADLARVQAGFRRAVNRIGGELLTPIHFSPCHSLWLSEDESLLLRYLAHVQSGRNESGASLSPILSDRRLLTPLIEALDELAAVLAFGGYWLPDPQDSPAPTAAAHWLTHKYIDIF